jgi:hypothetical protein
MQFQFRVGNDGGGRSFVHVTRIRCGNGITNKMAVRKHRYRAVHHARRADGAMKEIGQCVPK